jgi:hypothetical protein
LETPTTDSSDGVEGRPGVPDETRSLLLRLLRRLFGGREVGDEGISLDTDELWEVGPTRDAAAFLRALPELLAEGTMLYLEGRPTSREAAAFLEASRVEPQAKVAKGTIWPTPKSFHLPMSRETIAGLADLFESHASPEICDHFHAYRERRVLLCWYDAFYDDPVLVRGDVSEEAVRRFCHRLGVTYARCRSG